MTVATDDHVRELPKTELNCHVEGAARMATIVELATKNGVPIPDIDVGSASGFESFTQFLAAFDTVCGSLRTVDDFQRITYEGLEDAAAAGVRYREMFFSPSFFVKFGVPLETAWVGIVRGISEAHADLDIHCRMILDLDRSSDADQAMALVEFAASQDRDLLVAVGADSTWCGGDVANLVPAFREASIRGLHRTCHAGEHGSIDSIRFAIEDLGCERVDHGTSLLDDASLARRVIDEQIPVTVCPTSNVKIAHAYPDLESQPLRQQRDAGVLVALNVGDPGLMGVDIADEYAAVKTAFHYDLEAMEQISLDGIAASFAPREEKVSLRKRFIREFNDLRQKYRLEPYPLPI